MAGGVRKVEKISGSSESTMLSQHIQYGVLLISALKISVRRLIECNEQASILQGRILFQILNTLNGKEQDCPQSGKLRVLLYSLRNKSCGFM